MKYVYIIKSIPHRDRYHSGVTEDPERMLTGHNQGGSADTVGSRPWEPRATIRFEDDQMACDFERYLKTGAGQAFARRHF